MKTIKEIIAGHLDNVKKEIEGRMAALGRNASGRSVRSLSTEATATHGILRGSKSFLVMERGRRGGRVPKGFFGIIRQWIIDKGIPVTPIPSKRPSSISPHERGLRSMSGAIAYSIQNEQKGSLKQLRAELSNLTAQYDALSAAERDGAQGEELRNHINEVTDALKEGEEATQRYYRNVGNYKESVNAAFASLTDKVAEARKEYQELLKVQGDSTEAVREAKDKYEALNRLWTSPHKRQRE